MKKTIRCGGVVFCAALVLIAGNASAQQIQKRAPTTLKKSSAETKRAAIAVPAHRVATKIAPKLVAAMAVNDRLSGNVTEQETVAYKRVSERLRHKDRAAAQAEWTAAIRGTQRRGVRPDVEALAGYVLHHAYIAGSRELQSAAAELKFYETQRKAAYRSRADLARMRRNLDRGRRPQNASLRPLRLTKTYRPGARAVAYGEAEPATVDSVADQLQGIVVLCNQTEEKAERANIEMQNALQKQQQTLQTISNVSKMLHDTAMAIIRKLG